MQLPLSDTYRAFPNFKRMQFQFLTVHTQRSFAPYTANIQLKSCSTWRNQKWLERLKKKYSARDDFASLQLQLRCVAHVKRAHFAWRAEKSPFLIVMLMKLVDKYTNVKWVIYIVTTQQKKAKSNQLCTHYRHTTDILLYTRGLFFYMEMKTTHKIQRYLVANSFGRQYLLRIMHDLTSTRFIVNWLSCVRSWFTIKMDMLFCAIVPKRVLSSHALNKTAPLS